RPDHVEELMCLDLREPTRPATTTRIEHELEGAGPPPPARRLVDREGAPQQGGAALGHRDRDELPGTDPFRHLGRDDRDRVVRADALGVQDLRADAPNGPASRTPGIRTPPRRGRGGRSDVPGTRPPPAAGGGPKISRSWTATAASAAAWCSCSERGSPRSPRADSIPRRAARTAGRGVRRGSPAGAAAARISDPSVRGPRPNGVFTTRSTSASRIRSTTERPPPETLETLETAIPARSSTAAVPRVASRLKPRSARRLAGYRIDRLSRFATERKIVPSRGSEAPLATRALASARPGSASIPITSPVERSAGPR